MSEKNKDLYKSPKEQIKEIVNKKEISKNLDSLKNKSNDVQDKYHILWKISQLWKKLWTNYNIKVARSPIEWAYFLQINWNKLDIAIKSQEKLDKIILWIEKWLENKIDNSKLWKTREITWIWDNNIYLTWDITGRTIKADDSILPTWFDSEIIDSKKILSKEEIEEIFTLIMHVKWIKKEDWDIESTVCRKNKITAECKDELWIK